MKYITLLSLLTTLILFCSWNIFCRPPPRTPAKKVFLSAAKLIEKKYGVKISAEGGRSQMNKRESTGFHFIVKSPPLTIDEVRPLIVPIAEDFLNAINAHPEIADELIQYPFTWNNITIGLIFEQPSLKKIYAPYVWSVSAMLGKVFYNILVYHPPQPGVYTIDEKDYQETMQEAQRILSQTGQ